MKKAKVMYKVTFEFDDPFELTHSKKMGSVKIFREKLNKMGLRIEGATITCEEIYK